MAVVRGDGFSRFSWRLVRRLLKTTLWGVMGVTASVTARGIGFIDWFGEPPKIADAPEPSVPAGPTTGTPSAGQVRNVPTPFI